MDYRSKKLTPAFTLSEVLIVLVVIAVIVMLTVPSIITRYVKKQTALRLQKAYSTISNALNMAVVVNGDMSTWTLGTTGNPVDAYKFAQKYIFPYVELQKDCVLSAEGDCAYSYSNLNGETLNVVNGTYIRYYLNDGTLITNRVVNPGGTRAGYIQVLIDINGKQGPNIMGKDVFQVCIFIKSTNTAFVGRFVDWGFGLTRDELMVPNGGGCNKDGEGWYCLSLIMLDGWKIKDDYPW